MKEICLSLNETQSFAGNLVHGKYWRTRTAERKWSVA